MEKQSLYIYSKDAEGNKVRFPNAENPARLGEYTYTAQRMAGTPTLTATLNYPSCLDELWTGGEFVEFRGEKYFIDQVPSSSKDNKTVMFKHELQFVSQRIVLENVYFMDVVTPGRDTYHSNSTTVKFYGDVKEFVARLNASMRKSGLEYSVVIDEDVTSEAKLVQLENTYIADALQNIYTLYDLPYYFVGKVCHIGYTENVISTPFEYRKGLVSIKKTNANYKVVNRVTGVGSSDNIPFYYPNDAQTGTIERASALMPSIYRETGGAERFYDAENGKYKIPGTDEYYTFKNPYSPGKVREIKVDYSDIKPTIEGVENASGQLFGEIAGIAFDDNDSDEVGTGDSNNVFNESDEYVHPYFYLKLHLFNGDFGFNLFEHALEGGTAVINMTSGNCAACDFEIGVTYKEGETRAYNPVMTDVNGNLPSGDFEQKVTSDMREYVDRQQDTTTNEVWIAVKKDNQSFGVVMPNATNNYRPQVGDKFVITGIKMPKSLVLAAERRLDEALIKYMAENNDEKFTFSVSFSRVYLANDSYLINTLNENARIYIRYNDREYLMYVSSYTCKADKNCLYDISVELTDKLSANVSSLRSTITEIAGNVIGSKLTAPGGISDVIADKTSVFLRKDIDDTARRNITFCESIHSKDYIEGFNTGNGWRIDKSGDADFNAVDVRTNLVVGNRGGSPTFISGFPNGIGWDLGSYKRTNAADVEETKWRLEIDDINVRGQMRVYEMVISQLRGENDNVIFAGMMRVLKADRENEIIYLDTEKGVLYNPFRSGDILMVQRFGGMPSAENQYNVIKQYELRVKEAYVGNLSDGEERVDWIKVEKFVGDWDDVAERDVLTRVDSLTDSTRKGIVKVTTVDEIGAPYIDVVYGMKTDSDNSTKVRMGNLSGVRTRNNRDLTGVWGLYAEGAVLENSTYYMQDGNTVEQNFTILNGKLESEISTVKADMSVEAGNILKNSSFGSNMRYWESVDEVHFMLTADGYIYGSDYFYVEKNKVADIVADNGRYVLRLRDCAITQANSVMNKTGISFEGTTEKDEEGNETTIYPNFSFAFFYKPLTAGTLKVGFTGKDLYAEEQLTAANDYAQFSRYAGWDGTGDFTLSYTGEMLLYGVSLYNDKLADAKIYLEGKITQTAEALTVDYTKLIADSEGNIMSSMESQFKQTADSISTQATRIDNINNTIANAGWITTADGNEMWASKTLADGTELTSLVTQTADGLTQKVSSEDYNGETIISMVNQTAKEYTISASKINLKGAVTFEMLADSAIEGVQPDLSNYATMGDIPDVSNFITSQTVIAGGLVATDFVLSNGCKIGYFTITAGLLNGTSAAKLYIDGGAAIGPTNVYNGSYDCSLRKAAADSLYVGGGSITCAQWIIAQTGFKSYYNSDEHTGATKIAFKVGDYYMNVIGGIVTAVWQ